LRRKAAEEDGIPALRERVENEERAAADIDQRLDELEKRVHDLMDRRGTYASGDDEITKQGLEVLSRQMAREPLG
jgi:archaellum component FlaC